MPDCEIKRVDVWHMTKGQTDICWELSSNFFPKGRLWFFVDFGQPATDTWIALNEEPVEDACCFTDLCQRNWGTINESFYRVRLILPDESGQPVIKSQPVQANGRLDRRDWLWARDIVRREHLQQRKSDGTAGFLLKRKKFGQACPECLEWDTKEVTDSNCPACYGTGIVGGYYQAVEFWFTLPAGWQRRIAVATPPRGTNADILKNGARCVLYPPVDTRDVWVKADSDERYIIDNYQAIAEVRGRPLIAMAQIRLAPATDVVYDVPLEAPSSSSSSTGVVAPVRRGLASDYEDW